MAETSLPVEHLFTLSAQTNIVGFIANAPQGTRVIVDVPGGTFTGAKLTGTVVAPSGDWLTARADGTIKLDVRVLLKTADGADILMTYTGVGAPNLGPVRTAPLFETGDERYAWLNAVQAVGIGVIADGSITYEVYRLL